MIGDGNYRRLLLIRRKGLGDALVTMPAVLELKRALPAATIDLVVDRPFAGLLAGLSPDIRIVQWPPPPGVSWLRELRTAGYDLVIDWLGSPRTALWTVLSGAGTRIGYDLPQRRWAYNVRVPRNRTGRHQLRGFAGEAFLDPLRALGLEPGPWRDGYAAALREGRAGGGSVGQDVSDWATAWLERGGVPVAVVMSAGWPAKMWPVDQVRGLLAGLKARGVNPVLISGPGDEWLLAGLSLQPGQGDAAPVTTLPELAHLLARSRLLVGTDCGPRHLAAAMGLPTVTIFGPTDPVGWNPASPRHVAVRHAVPCAPCNLTSCPVAGHPCLADLDSGTVIAEVERVLAATGKERSRGQAQ